MSLSCLPFWEMHAKRTGISVERNIFLNFRLRGKTDGKYLFTIYMVSAVSGIVERGKCTWEIVEFNSV